MPKGQQSSNFKFFHFYNIYYNIYIYIYIYIYLYKQFPMLAYITESLTNIVISSKDNKGQYNPTLIKLLRDFIHSHRIKLMKF